MSQVEITDFDPAAMLDDEEAVQMFVEFAAEGYEHNSQNMKKALQIAQRARKRLQSIENEI